ncbi:MAG: contact-dependent growth inhibition system immunity protein [Pirellula sp.]
MTHPVKFADVDGLDSNQDDKSSLSMLDEWYASIRNVPVDELQIGDLARACRQKLHLRLIVPVIANELRLDPLAGEIYDGELVKSLLSVPRLYWVENPVDAKDLLDIALTTVVFEDDDVRDSFLQLKEVLAG